jgi:hypothetical protein
VNLAIRFKVRPYVDWGVFAVRGWREYLRIRRTKLPEICENSMKRGFVVCTPQQILLERANQGGYDG